MSAAPLDAAPPAPADSPARSFAPERIAVALTALAAAAWAHLRFSPFGFNPTDEGFVLAYARRVLEGEIPHRDFISIRPAGSAYLHLPEVAFGGDHVFWLSRAIVWLQWAVIAWAWASLVLPALHPRRDVPRLATTLSAAAVAVLAFALSSNRFPVLAWHSIDGLFLFALGALALASPRPAVRLAGFALAGASAVCKQSFVPLALATPFVFGAWRDPRAWGATLLVPAVYATVVVVTGGAADAWAQLFAHSGFVDVAVFGYLRAPAFLPAAAAGAVAALLAARASRAPGGLARAGAGIAAVLAFAMIASAAARAGGTEIGVSATALLGFVLGTLVVPERGAVEDVRPLGAAAPLAVDRRLRAAAALAAWSASISIGHATPDLGAGALAAALLPTAARWTRAASVRRGSPWPLVFVTVVLAAQAALVMSADRGQRVYRDASPPELRHDLAGVVPGAAGIRTGPGTFACLEDLARWDVRLRDRVIAIVPDGAAWWVASARRNPLPIDWPQETELATPELVERVVRALESRRGRIGVLVGKYEMGTLPEPDPLPLDTGRYAVVQHVVSRWRATAESEFFVLYE